MVGAEYSGALSVGTTDGGRAAGTGKGNRIVSLADGTANTMLMTEVAGRGLAAYIRGRAVAQVTYPPTANPLVANPPGFGVGNQNGSQFARGTWADQNGTPVLYGQSVTASGHPSRRQHRVRLHQRVELLQPVLVPLRAA